MAATVTGSNVIDASGGNGNTGATIDVPATTMLAIAFWSHWDNNGGSTLSGLTHNGASFTLQQLSEGAVSDENGIGVGYLLNPTVADNQTIAWTWSAGGARAEGGEIVVVWVTGAHATVPIRDRDNTAATDTTDVSLTIDSSTTDLILAFCQNYVTGGPPVADTTGSSESTFIDNGATNNHEYDVRSAVGAVTSTGISMTGEYYSSMSAVSIIVADAGGTFVPYPFSRGARGGLHASSGGLQ